MSQLKNGIPIPSRILVLGLLAAVSTTGIWHAVAQQPPAAPQLPSQQPPAQANDQGIQRSILEALQGKPTAAPEDEPLLDDVLDLIRRQGSVLDGSMLGAAEETPAAAEPKEDTEAQCRAAEALLRASRLLTALPGEGDPDRHQLAQQMRRQAAKCLQAAGLSPSGPASSSQDQ